jgi:DNA-binding PadR family transcriptional regulator
VASLVDGIVDELCERIVRNFVDVFILFQLARAELSGYGIIGQIHKRYGILMSSGTVYSMLYSMERRGLIEARSLERKRLYALTQKGEREIRDVRRSNGKIKNMLAGILAIGEI